MKTISLCRNAICIAGLLALGACNETDRSNAKDIANNMADSAAVKIDTAVDKMKAGAGRLEDKLESSLKRNPDSNFVVKASLDNNKEIRLLQAALDNGTDKELKAHAKMMLADHKKLGAGVKAYSAKKGYILADGDNGKADDELATLSKKNKGADWDKEWVDALTSGHKDAVDLFEKGKDDVKDAELKNMITDALPTLHSHLDMMTKLQDKMRK